MNIYSRTRKPQSSFGKIKDWWGYQFLSYSLKGPNEQIYGGKIGKMESALDPYRLHIHMRDQNGPKGLRLVHAAQNVPRSPEWHAGPITPCVFQIYPEKR